MPEAKAFELQLTPQLEEMLSRFVPAILGTTSRDFLERLTNREKYALRQAFLKVTAIEKLNMDPRYVIRSGRHYYRQHIGLLSGIPAEALPQPLVEQLKTGALKISDTISEFFIGRTSEAGATSKGDPRQLCVTLYGASAETIHATLCTVLESLKNKESQGKIAGRDTVVFWGIPNTSSDEFNKLVRSNLKHTTDYGPNVVLVLPTPCRRDSRFGSIYSDSQETIEVYGKKISEISHAFYSDGDYPKIAVVYYDVDGISEEGEELKFRKDEETGIPVQAVQSVPLISPKAWAEFPEFRVLPEKLIQDINSLSEGDILLMKCLLHACHEYIQKDESTQEMRLTPEIVVIALQNYLQIFGIDHGTASDVTFLQRLLLLSRVVSYPNGIVDGHWWQSAFSGGNRNENAGDLEHTLCKRHENTSLHSLLREALIVVPGGGVPYGAFEIKDDRYITFTPVVDGAPTRITSSYRLDQNLLRVLRWLLKKGHAFNESLLSDKQVKAESGVPIFSVVCMYCEGNISRARVEKGQIIADKCMCENCGSKNFRLRVEYMEHRQLGNAS